MIEHGPDEIRARLEEIKKEYDYEFFGNRPIAKDDSITWLISQLEAALGELAILKAAETTPQPGTEQNGNYVAVDTSRPKGVGFMKQPLWSLLDMLRIYAHSFSTLVGDLRSSATLLQCVDRQADMADTWQAVQRNLEHVATAADRLPLSYSLKRQAERVLEAAKENGNITAAVTMINELHSNLMSEMSQQVFLVIPSQWKKAYENPDSVFSSEVEGKFPEARKDLHDGVRCFVLNQWTASVFHFMRALEHGLRSLAEAVELNGETLTLQNWNTIIEQIESKIRQIDKLPRTPEKSENVRFFSEAAANFRFFKDAWRNHVSHGRATYDEGDAERVMLHVSDFMKHLAGRA